MDKNSKLKAVKEAMDILMAVDPVWVNAEYLRAVS